MSVTSSMKQQIGVLDQLDALIKECEAKKLTDGATVEEITGLKNYISSMRTACDTAIKLQGAIDDAKKAEKKSKEEKVPVVAKPEKPKADSKPKAKKEPEPVVEDDLSFLD